MKKLVLIFIIVSLLLYPHIVYLGRCQATYAIIPDFPENTKIPVNCDTQLSATISPPPGFSITVTVKLQWELTSRRVSSDPTTGKVVFTVKPPSSFGRTPQTITFSSDYFQTVTTRVVCVPGTLVEGKYDKNQHWDPIENKDIVINMTVKDSETGAVIKVPSAWDVKVVGVPLGSSPSDVQFLPPAEITSGTYQISLNSINNIAGRYVIEVKASYWDYVPIPSRFEVNLSPPIVVITYRFQTGEKITIKPEDVSSGNNGIQVTKGCQYFDMEFRDYQGRPIRVYLSTFDITITSSTATFTKSGGQVDVQQLSENVLRVNFPLTESWYIITPNPEYTVYIGSYPVSITQNEVKVATIRTGFNIWDFITNPYIMVPAALILLLLFGRIFGFGRKEAEE